MALLCVHHLLLGLEQWLLPKPEIEIQLLLHQVSIKNRETVWPYSSLHVVLLLLLFVVDSHHSCNIHYHNIENYP